MVFREFIRNIYFTLIILVIISVVSSFTGCANNTKVKCENQGRNYRIYVHDAARGLFIRDLKDKDVKTYKEGDGLVCLSTTDLAKMAEDITTRKFTRCK